MDQERQEKTEHTALVRHAMKEHNEQWRNVIKLGSKLGDSEDIAHRKQLSNNAMGKVNNLWIKKDKRALSTQS